MMKASVTNLLGNLSIGDGEAVARSMGELVESASTFFFGNFIPMLQTIFNNLPTAIGTAVSIYEIIMRAYTQAYQQNGVSYRVVAKKGYLNVEEMGKVVCSIEITEDSNITSSNYKESITNMVNKVRIYDGEGKPQGVVQNDADVKKYGIFQQTYTKEEGKDATTTAKSMFKTVEKTFTLECVNLNEAVTGAGAVVRDSSTGLSGVVWIDADTHTWQNGVATMSLTVTLKQMMDTKEG